MENNRWWNRIIDKLIFWRKPQNEEIKSEEETKLKASGKCGRQRRRAREGMEFSCKLRAAMFNGGMIAALNGGSLTIFSGKRPVGIDRKPGKRNRELVVLPIRKCYFAEDTDYSPMPTLKVEFEEGTNIREGRGSWTRIFSRTGAPLIDGSVGHGPSQLSLNSDRLIEGAHTIIDSFTLFIPGE